MDIQVHNHKSNSRHKAHGDGYLLLFFEGDENVPLDTEQYLHQGLAFYPRRVMVFS